MTLFAATSNNNKIIEFNTILSALNFSVGNASQIYELPDVIEDGKTFEENAIKKAIEIASHIGKNIFAEDSGLEVFSLNGEPGIYSARYGGEGLSDLDKNDLILKKLGDTSERGARYVCVLAFASPRGLIATTEGEVRGTIAHEPAGQNGFGFDPIFIPDGYHTTFGELANSVKNSISHRTCAIHNACAIDLFDTNKWKQHI